MRKVPRRLVKERPLTHNHTGRLEPSSPGQDSPHHRALHAHCSAAEFRDTKHWRSFRQYDIMVVAETER